MSGEEAKRRLAQLISDGRDKACIYADVGLLRALARLLDEQEKALEQHVHLLSVLRRATEAVPPTGHDLACRCEVCWVQRDALLKGVALAFARAVQLQPTELSRLRRVEEAAKEMDEALPHEDVIRRIVTARPLGEVIAIRRKRLAAALDGKQEARNG